MRDSTALRATRGPKSTPGSLAAKCDASGETAAQFLRIVFRSQKTHRWLYIVDRKF